MKKKIIAIGIISMFLLTSFSVIAVVAEEPNSSEQITLDYSFETPVISNVDINGSIYDRIIIEDAPVCGNPDEPSLPGKGVSLLIPQGEKVSSITVTHGEIVNLGPGYLVVPVGEPVLLSEISSAPLPTPDETIYSSNEPFPGKLFTEVGTYSCKGYQILIIKLHPVQYIPATGELYYYPDLSISVETTPDAGICPMFRGLEKDQSDIINKVDNPETAGSYDLNEQLRLDSGQTVSSSSYELLIITSDELKDDFEPLKGAHEEDGLSTLIYTVEEIYSKYSGVDNADKIRNYIKYAYQNYGIEYVLLGGDHEIVPSRYMYYEVGYNIFYPLIISDLYYTGLDGDWNGKPESPYPSNKDLSINDPGVSGYCEGRLSGPYIDNANFIVGDSSMRLDYDSTPEPPYGSLILEFDSPIDLSNENWIRFSINCSRPNIIDHTGSRLWSKLGEDWYDWPIFSIPTFSFSEGSWDTHITLKGSVSGPYLFNIRKVRKIEIVFTFNSAATNGDFIRLDGIHLSKFSDLIFGEHGEEDFYADVYVGRACVDNSDEVQNFVSKTVAYMNTDDVDEYLKKVSMVGEYLIPRLIAGGKFMDDLIGECTKWGYTTQGFPAEKFSIDTLYEYDWPGNDWPKSEIISRINNNVHIINHFGHSLYDYNMKMEISDVADLNNNKFCFIYSMGCDAGGFHNPKGYDCIAEHFTVKTDRGAFAGIWNTFTGGISMIWDIWKTTDCVTQRFHREFWDAVFNKGIKELGRANQVSKEENLWRINEIGMRYGYKIITLFGDPAVAFINYNNQKPNKPTITGPTNGKAGTSYNYNFVSIDPDGEDVSYYIEWGDGSTTTWTTFQASGSPGYSESHTWSAQGTYTVRAKAKNTDGHESDWSDPLPVSIAKRKNNPVDPVDPVDPDPVDPVDPVDPIDPIDPVVDPVDPDPVDPVDPVDPIDPIDPIEPDPIVPINPIEPVPVDPIVPINPIDPDPADQIGPSTGSISNLQRLSR